HAMELPSNLSLIGDFTLEVDCDKTSLNSNEVLSITVRIEGEGNFEDIKPFKPFIEGVSVFEEKPLLEKGKWSQKITFVADGDFIIPPLALEYFDLATKTAQKLQTKPISIKIKNQQSPKELTILKQTQPASMKATEQAKDIFFWVWIFVALVAGGCIGYVLAKKEVGNLFKKEAKSSIREPKTLLMKLLPYKEDPEVSEIIAKLEKNIYEKQNLQIEKKILKEVLKRYGLS
ncbi:MAG: oxygen-tolerance protein, partial [Thiovulaceae bacterium]|nr:oxygen-tolerance protein [Sulfurimonadaceae bacterium]